MCLQWPQDWNWKNTHNQHPSIGDIWALKSWTNLCTKPLSLSKLTQLSAQYLDWHLMKHAWDAWNMTEKSLTRTEVNVRSDICLRPALNRHEAQLQKKWLQKQDHPWKLFRSGLSSATDAQTRKNQVPSNQTFQNSPHLRAHPSPTHPHHQSSSGGRNWHLQLTVSSSPVPTPI